MRPLVSIITPTYNSEKFINETIGSVLKQTYKNWELILIDDASTDDTLRIIKSYIKNNFNISLIRNSSNQGAGVSRNKGILEAKGDFIAFLDADDTWRPNKLKTQIKFMIENNVDVCYSSYDLIDEDGIKLNKRVNSLPTLSYRKLLKSNYVGNLTGMYNCKSLGKIVSNKLRKRQDWILWLYAIKKSGKPAKGIKESLAYYRVRKNSMSSNKIGLIKYNYLVYREGMKFSILKSVFCFIIFVIEQVFVKSKQISHLPKN